MTSCDPFRHDRRERLPPWFKIRLATSERSHALERLIAVNKLNTVCRSAACPNRSECWRDGIATFMILGTVCTRGCRFCNVLNGIPAALDPDEPRHVADAVHGLGLEYVVITSVTRDDLADGGAAHFVRTMAEIRMSAPHTRIEALIPDLRGDRTALQTVLDARPEVLSHNVETVPSYYPIVRPQADYRRSLDLLNMAHANGCTTKSGFMLGFGESREEVSALMHDLRSAGCEILTLGQYLQPSKNHLPVRKYYYPDEFTSLYEEAMSMGFRHVAAGPRVRSSYHAGRYGAGLVGQNQAYPDTL
jgi:lipoic acid synthetase